MTLAASGASAGAQDYIATRIFQFQQTLGDRPITVNSRVTIGDTEKNVYITPEQKTGDVYFSISDDTITIRAGMEPIVFTGDQKRNLLKGAFLPYSIGAMQLFAASAPDIDYVLIGYDPQARISTIVHLKKK
jgi:hypothetical protein